MALDLYAHPFSSYCQKVLIALYENGTPFNYRTLGAGEAQAEFETRWPVKRMPLLVDGGQEVAESSVIIEYLALHHAGPVPLLPADAEAALDVRFMDRFLDNYVMGPMQRIVADFIRPPEQRHPPTVAEAKAMLDTAYGWLEHRLAGSAAAGPWACGAAFSLADCAAAPSLFYADWVHPLGTAWPQVTTYRARLLARPSCARAVEEARPFRHFFPPGAPDRD